MGTNFYFYIDGEEYEHIGKRSAAGLYCWDCGVSLCDSSFDNWNDRQLYGSEAVHYSQSHWLDSCPLCGQKPKGESLSESSVGRELGFNKKQPTAKTGVKSCSSFGWAISPQRFVDLTDAPNVKIMDEYGREYSKVDFVEMLRECPIKRYEHVGVEFS